MLRFASYMYVLMYVLTYSFIFVFFTHKYIDIYVYSTNKAN